ncbi:MAG: glycoside hydrolase family 20 zincin-like fold domain-containing protein [Terracidiphilus sp.]
MSSVNLASAFPLARAFACPAALLLCCSTFAAAQAQIHLLPAPREAHFAQTTPLAAKILVEVPGHNSEDEFAADDLKDAVKNLAPDGDRHGDYRVLLLRTDSRQAKDLLTRRSLVFSAPMQAEGYVLVIGPREAGIVAASAAGIFYGVQTFKQLLPLPGEPRVLPTGTVRDWPAMRYRGIDDDLSRGPFPTLAFQEHQIRVFAAFKINIYSPYFENTLLYPGQPLAAPPGGALTPAQAKKLVEFAANYHVTIVPEQEAFGHLHHVLEYDIYQDVAETPHGFVLAPGQPGTIPLIKDWFGEIAKEFPSPFIHIGADETFDLGIGRTRAAVKKEGYGPVYVQFLTRIHHALAPLHRRLLFWGDIGDANPAAVPGLPKDMIAVPWNYGPHADFAKLIEPFAKAGMETWVAPGDGNWNEVYPIEQNAFLNIQGFIGAGQKLGSTGALTTVWNDDGEGLFNLDWYGVLFGAVAAWQPGQSSIPDYRQAYGAVFFHDASGKIDAAEDELMAAEAALATAKTGLNSDQLFWLDPWSAEGQAVSVKILPVAKELRIHAERAIVLLDQARLDQAREGGAALLEPEALDAMDLGARRLDFIGMKFEMDQEIESMYAQAVARQHDKAQRSHTGDMLNEISSMNGRCQDLRDAFSAIKAEYSHVWLSENRPYWLGNVTVRYDLAIERWQRRGDRFETAIRGWQSGKDLPPDSVLGLPAAPAVGSASQ